MKSILVVRPDNIGDLVCTTPLLSALRQRYPAAWIGALVNSYNAAVLERNPDLDEAVVYRKLKHLDAGESALGALVAWIGSLARLRARRLDCVIIATTGFIPRTLHFARLLAPRQVIGFSDGSRAARRIDLSVPLSQVGALHEVERVFVLAAHLGIEEPIPPMCVVPDPAELRRAATAFASVPAKLKIAVQISSRRPAQRWPTERFAALIERLHAERDAACMLLWSPGPPDHPRHPGDDDKAEHISHLLRGKAPLIKYDAGPLQGLVGALAACDAVVTSDGGAMHLAAALGKPIVAFFGDMPPERWRPWGVPHRVLRSASGKVADLSVDEVMSALDALLA